MKYIMAVLKVGVIGHSVGNTVEEILGLSTLKR